MKHRICSNNGFGSGEKELLNNKGEIDKDFADDAIVQFFKEWQGFDFEATNEYVAVGIEPTYQFDKLKIVKICKNKEDSTYTLGQSFGPYGSKVVKRTARLGNFVRKSQFTRFVDKWHPVLFKETK